MFWLKRILSRKQIYDDLAEEMQQHIEEKTAALVAGGLPQREAESQARREFGNPVILQETAREVWQWPSIESIFGDARFACRQLKRTPGFAVIAIATLALGIGASTAVFSLFDAVLLHPVPYHAAGRLVLITEALPRLGHDLVGVSVQEANDYQAGSASFAETATFEKAGFNLTGTDHPMRINAALLSSSVFPLLQVSPVLGRTFTKDEESNGAERVAVISWALWKNLYAADSGVLGKTIKLDETPYTIIGVMPASFHFPFDGSPQSERGDLWLPLRIDPILLDPQNRVMEFGVGLIARLKPGVTFEQGRAGIERIAQAFQAQLPQTYTGTLHVEPQVFPFASYTVQKARPLILLLIGAVLCVLLITCANVANLLLARAHHRGQEMAVRAALGASRMRLLRQCLVESLLLSVGGASAGVLLAQALLMGLRRWGPEDIPRLHDAALHPVALLFAVGLSVLTAVLFGFVPAWKLSQTAPQAALSETRQVGSARRGQRFQDALASGEFALAIVLLVGGGLLARSFVQLLNTETGFDPKGVFIARTVFDRARYPDPQKRAATQKEILAGLAQLPGVQHVAAASHLPLSDERQIGFRLEHAQSNDYHFAANSLVSPGYFRAMGIRMLAGRDFDDRDQGSAPLTAVVNQEFVREHLPGVEPLGQRFLWGDRGIFTIVGVVADVRIAALDADPAPMIYNSMFQVNSGASGRTAFVLRSQDGRQVSFTEVQRVAASFDRDLPLYNTTSMAALVSESLAQRRFTIILIGAFSFSAVLLAMMGLFGVISYMVGKREREFGVRMALGANQGMILAMVFRRGMQLGLWGCLLGLALSLMVTSVLRASLYHVSRFDPLTLIAVPCLALLVAAAAVLVPAARAASVDPMQALRVE